MQMQIVVTHDFSSLEAVVRNVISMLVNDLGRLIAEGRPISPSQLPIANTGGAAGVTVPFPAQPVAPSGVAPKPRGRPRKAPAEAIPTVHPTTPPLNNVTAANVAAQTPQMLPGFGAAVDNTPASQEQISELRTYVLEQLVPVCGDDTYIKIRGELGNPIVASLTRDQCAAFMAKAKAAVEAKQATTPAAA